ncbi:MAG TPA: peptidylprolyl isomerase [Rhizomicrobium sp.]|nr:peptidylprolyl isomerase [Rhizomicrobium sp.]
MDLKKRIATTLFMATAGLLATAAPLCAQDNAAVPPAPTTTGAPAASVAAIQPDAPAAPQTIDASDKPDINNADGIAATVNDESISDYELRQRVALFVATSGLQPNAEDLKRIRGQILEQMVDEKLRLQEAVKKHITVSPVEVDKAINSLLAQNHLTMDQLRAVLIQAGASDLALRKQITAQLAWQKTVQDEYSDRVNISQAQVDAELQRYADGAAKPHFLVNEIFLPVSSPEQDPNVLKNAENIEQQIKDGASFGAVAHQFSQNPAAALGGAIGWVHEGQLAAELNAALVQMKPGDLSSPIRSAGGYYILNLQARQEPLGTKIDNASATAANPDGTLPLSRLLLPLGANPSQDIIEAGMQAAGQIHQAFNGCDRLKALAEKMKGTVFMDLGNMKPSDLSPEIQKALAQTHSGETTVPLRSDAGVELIARCDKRVEVLTAYQLKTREQVESELFDQQISALAQRYMRDLKRGADVEVR